MYTYLLKETRVSARTKFQWECKTIFAQYFLKMWGFRFTIMEVLLEVFEKRRVKTNQNHIFFTPEHLLCSGNGPHAGKVKHYCPDVPDV